MASVRDVVPMELGERSNCTREQAEKYQRLEQLITSGDVTAVSVVLNEGPALDEEDMLSLWFAIFRSRRAQDTIVLLQCFLENGQIDPEEVDNDSMSALHLACSHCLRDCVEFLLQLSPKTLNEADVFGMLPLHHAISMCKTQLALEGDDLRNSSDSMGLRSSSDFSITQNDLPTAESIVKLLLDHGAHVNLSDSCSSSRSPSYTTPLCFAVDIGNVRVVEMLLKADAIVNPSLGRGEGGCPRKCPPLQCALDNSDIALAELLVLHGSRCNVQLTDQMYLTHHYCEQGNLPAVQFLLNHGLDVNQTGGVRKETPLRVAAAHGFANIMELLLDRGANIPSDDSSLLTTAVFSGNVCAVRLLLDHGVPLNTQATFGITSIYVACSKSADMVELLLSHGADPNLGMPSHKPVSNILALHRRSVTPEAAGIVRALIKYNADVNIQSKDHFYKRGQVPLGLLHRALLCGEAQVVFMLLQVGAELRGLTEEMLDSFNSKCANEPKVVQLLHYQRLHPYSLAQMCRTAIRKCFHSSCVKDIELLPLPPQILDYLTLCDL